MSEKTTTEVLKLVRELVTQAKADGVEPARRWMVEKGTVEFYHRHGTVFITLVMDEDPGECSVPLEPYQQERDEFLASIDDDSYLDVILDGVTGLEYAESSTSYQ